jgi:hypothetical protein
MEDIAMDKIPEFRPVGKEGKLAKRDTQEVFLSLSQIPLNENHLQYFCDASV